MCAFFLFFFQRNRYFPKACNFKLKRNTQITILQVNREFPQYTARLIKITEQTSLHRITEGLPSWTLISVYDAFKIKDI